MPVIRARWFMPAGFFVSPGPASAGLFISGGGGFMQDDPGLWAQLVSAGGDLARHAWALAMGAFGAMLGYVYRHYQQREDGEEVRPIDWLRMLLEGLTCGFIAVTVSYGLEATGAPVAMGNFIGGSLGFVGTKAASEWAIMFAKRKTG
ncbi:phage holin family protein [Alcanivorax sp.]|uniref:phage holin family protein n=2 Tax=Alcanivorax TaxID=59753 RepID=UPI003A94148F